MKAKVFFISATLFFNVILFTSAQNTPQDLLAETQIKKFYTEYINSILQGPTEENERNFYAIQKKYLTQKLIDKVGTNPYQTMYTQLDPFLKANECDGEWTRTLVVKKNLTKPCSYIVTYLYLKDPRKRHNFTKSTTYVSIVNENGNIKIDSVW